MPGLASLAWRTVRARPVRAALTAIGIALGVAVLFAGLLTNAGIERSIDRTVDALVGRADVRVSAFRDQGLSPTAVASVRAIPGVVVAAPVIERRTFLAPAVPGSREPGLPAAVTVVGIDPTIDPQIRDLALRAGSALAGSGARFALISDSLARDDGLGVGDELELDGSADARAGDLRFVVGGILAGDGPSTDPDGRTVVIPIERAVAAFGPIGVSHLDLRLGDGLTADAASVEIGRQLTNEPYVIATPGSLAASLRASTTEFQATTALVASVALFAGAFLIFNTLAMTVSERIREVGLLRAAGATRRQVVAVVLAAAAFLGLAGSLAGLGVGTLLATAMATRIADLGGLRPADVPSSPDAAVLAVVAGLAVTLAAAAEPALRASAISPVDALRPQVASRASTASRLRWLVAVFVVVGVAGLLLRPTSGGGDVLLRGAGGYLALLVLALAVPWLLVPLGILVGVPFRFVLRAEERLARGALSRDRGRAALTVGALAVGLATLVALGGLAGDARGSASDWITSVVPGDMLATSVTPRPLDDGTVADLAAAPGVARVTPIAGFDVAFDGIRADAAAVVGADLRADGRLTFLAGDRTAALTALDAGGAVLVPRSLAERLGLRVGDPMHFPVGGEQAVDLRVSGIVARSLPGTAGEAILVGWKDATTGFGVTGADAFAVRFRSTATDADRSAFDDRVRSIGLQPATLASVEAAVGDALGRVFGLFDGLAALAVIIGGLGIANTLSMDVLERVRELGVLRAAGMTRRQVWRMVVVEAGLLGLVGAILGIGGGLAAGTVMRAIGSTGGGSAVIPWPSIGLAVVLGLGVSVLAAAYPAWLAGRQSIVRAVRAD
ncbi:MAG TPA: FtsX-like permease family protein [Candidatus Limnocylindrales bacterium]|nr:FtsX-like permease family protein [Candidatus Limnocylindrales bacterium]